MDSRKINHLDNLQEKKKIKKMRGIIWSWGCWSLKMDFA